MSSTFIFVVIAFIIRSHSSFSFPVPEVSGVVNEDSGNNNVPPENTSQNEGTKVEEVRKPEKLEGAHDFSLKQTKKAQSEEIIVNSPTCGTGYKYNTASHICERVNFGGERVNIGGKSDIDGGGGGGGGEELDDKSNTKNDERETMEYEEPAFIPIFPLECGMNYRYLKKLKICKFIYVPKSSESEEHQVGNVEENDDDDNNEVN